MSHSTAISPGRTAGSAGRSPTRRSFASSRTRYERRSPPVGTTAVRDDAVLETADQDPSLDDSVLEWAAIWKPLPKVVFSTTLSAVQGNARLASAGLAEEIERLRAEPGEGDIAIGGANLAAEAAALGLIDEYRARVYPVLVGGGVPFFSQRGHRVDLELVESRTFSSSVLYLRYRVTR